MRISPTILGIALFAATTTARADVLPPGGDPCANAVAGGTCSQASGDPGTCVAGKCSKLDYSQGSPPRSIETDCLRCEPTGAATPTATTTPPPIGADGPPPQPVTPTPDAQRGCNMTAPAGAPLLVLLLGLARRRRTRR